MTTYRSRYSMAEQAPSRPIRRGLSPVGFMVAFAIVYAWWLFVGHDQAESAHLRAQRAGQPAALAAQAAPLKQAAPTQLAQAAPPAGAPVATAPATAAATSATANDQPSVVRETYAALGTVVDVQISAPESKKPAELLAGVRQILSHVEHLYSNYDPTSFVSRLNDQAGGPALKVAPEEREVFDEFAAARRMSEITGGAFDITFESVGRFWRFDPENPRLPTAEEMRGATSKIDYRRVLVDREAGTIALEGKDTRVGLGGIAKGAAMDQAVAYLKANGVPAALLNIGGDFFGYGLKPNGKQWIVGLEHPRHKGEILPDIRIPVQDCGVFTSGDYERSFVVDGRLYHHIIDPRTAMPATGVVSVTVISKPPQYGLSLSIFVLGPEKGFAVARKLRSEGIECEAAVITDKGEILTTEGLPEAWRKIHVDLAGEATAEAGPIGAPTAPTSATARTKPSLPARAVEVPGE